MPHDSFIDPLFSRVWFLIGRRSKRKTNDEEPHYSGGGDSVQNTYNITNPPLQNARNFILNNATIIDRADCMITNNKTVLEILMPYSMPEAAMDSSARDPPPRCHIGTRIRIVAHLGALFDDPNRRFDMVWLHGPAGTGKSAIAQTFVESCATRGRLGAAFFFSRPNKRDRPEKVIPTIAYQLAFHCPSYNSAIIRTLVGDPSLLEKAMHVQFRKLIVEPFSHLQAQADESVQRPLLISLDGMDECAGETAQRSLINMIYELVSMKRGFPIFWLICSRPEPHLRHTFLRLPDCGREELTLDEECRQDVEKFVRDGFASLKDEYPDIVPPDWPPAEHLDTVLCFCSSLFAAASVAVKYVNDPTHANPVGRLNDLVSFLDQTKVAIGLAYPLISLDLLYKRILAEIPVQILPVSRQILSFVTRWPFPSPTCQVTCNLLRLDQNTFYTALRKLHSVLHIPAPEDAMDKPISFYHASFADYLRDANRSGNMYVDPGRARVDIAKELLFWHDLDATLFHTTDGIEYLNHHKEHVVPGLTWVSQETQEAVSRNVAHMAILAFDTMFALKPPELSLPKDRDLLHQIYAADFRYLHESFGLPDLVAWVYEQDPSSTFFRAKPLSDLEVQLSGYLTLLVGENLSKPASFPLSWNKMEISHFFLGYGQQTTLFCAIKSTLLIKLSADCPPSEEDIARVAEYL